MGIAAVETGLATVVARQELIRGRRTLAKPKLSLRLTACEDDVRELFDLLSQRRVGGLTHAGCSVGLTTCYSNEDILLRPITLAVNLSQLVEINFKLGSAMRERGSVILYCGIGAPAQADQFATSTVKPVVICMKLKSCQDASELCEMIGIFRANEKVNVHKPRFRGHVEPDFDVREDKLNVRQTTDPLLPNHFFISISDVVVRNSDGFNLRDQTFKHRQIISPGIGTTELVVQYSSRRVNVRLPTTPFRSSIEHSFTLVRLLLAIRTGRSQRQTYVANFQLSGKPMLREKLDGQQCMLLRIDGSDLCLAVVTRVIDRVLCRFRRAFMLVTQRTSDQPNALNLHQTA